MLNNYKLTPLKLQTNDIPYPGISVLDEMQQYPTTPTLLKLLGMDTVTINKTNIEPTTLDMQVCDMSMLRPYQLEDVAKLLSLKNAACLNEPRTGKTLTSLKTFQYKGVKKFLVVSPSSAMYQWGKEITRWTDYPVTVLKGTAKRRANLLAKWEEGALIISYDGLKTKQYKDEEGNYSHTLGDVLLIKKLKGIDGVIIDEAHRIRNKSTSVNAAVHQLRNIPNKLVLTGTPVLKEPVEIYAILNFLYPKLFKSYWAFKDYYFEQIEKTIYTSSGKKTINELGSIKKEQELVEFLNKMSTSRKRKDVMPWLPEKDRQYVYLPLTDEQAKYINELRKYFETEHIVTQGILDTLTRERQICNSPSLLALRGGSPKTDWLIEYIKDYPNKSIIVFSKFTGYLNELSKVLKTDCMITGQIDAKVCEQNKVEFQKGKHKVILINIDAGKESLTLDKADVIVFMDMFPPAGDIIQAEDRFVSTTEDKANKEHTIYYLVMEGSYEENILASLNNSMKEIDVVNNYRNYIKGGE